MNALILILQALVPALKAVAEAVVPILLERHDEPPEVRYYGRNEDREADIDAGIDAERRRMASGVRRGSGAGEAP